jgi:hypothetical protein
MIDAVFLNYLANARSKPEFDRMATGITAFGLYETVKFNFTRGIELSETIASVERDVQAMDAETSVAMRTALVAITAALPYWTADRADRIGRRATFTALLMYGQALGDDGEWRLAHSVFETVADDARNFDEIWTAGEAQLLKGRSARMCANWEESTRSYRSAYDIGREVGDLSLMLRARIGQAHNAWSRGDIPGARRRLNQVARRARIGCPWLIPRVTLAQAAVANAAGEYEHAIDLAFGLLSTLPDEDELKYQTLVDLAAFLTDYGLPTVAATALRIVERTAAEAHVRRHATVNLFFLAAQHGDIATFTNLRLRLTKERLTPRQQTQLALFTAQGYRRFCRYDAARSSAEAAAKFANQFELYQLVFEAEAELRAIDAAMNSPINYDAQASSSMPQTAQSATFSPSIGVPRESIAPGGKLPLRIRRVADSLEDMAREFALPDSDPLLQR